MEIARATHRPDRVIGTHFFNPAPVMKLLEVVRTIATSDQTLEDARALGERLGKRVIVAQDRGGFIVNLLLIPFLNNAVRLYESGFATKDDIDEGMKLGCGHPMGPLQLLDYIGLDTALFVCDALYEEYAIRDYAAPPLLKRMVTAGYLGASWAVPASLVGLATSRWARDRGAARAVVWGGALGSAASVVLLVGAAACVGA